MTTGESKSDKQALQIKAIIFGSNKSKQLISDKEIIDKPQIINIECNCVKHVACGTSHTVMCLCNGTVLCAGDNSLLQFGKKAPKSHFEKISLFKEDKCCYVACGSHFSVALSTNGIIYTWGSNNANQLGRAMRDEFGKIEIVQCLSNYSIIQVACGLGHCLALSIDSILFSWGENKHGQIGNGNTSPFVSVPEIVLSLECLPIKQIACGDLHSSILTTSGSVYTWGDNSHGQLGTGKNGSEEALSSNPIFLKSIKGIQIAYICVGSFHNALLTHDGGVFTFGDGRYGQLGHGNFEDQFSPRKVMDLMGSTVTQLSCGNFFTLVYVTESKRFYGFGKSDEGQLGIGIHTEAVDSPTKLDDFLLDLSIKKNSKDKRKSISDKLNFRRIYSGGNHSFILLTDEKYKETDDMRNWNYETLKYIAMINESIIEEFQKPRDNIKDEIISTVYTAMGSLGCLAASFLDKSDKNSHFSMNKVKHGVDIDACHAFYNKMMKTFDESEMEMLRIHMYENLLQLRNFQQNYPGIECLRSFLILLISPMINNVNWYDTITVPTLTAINSFATVPRNYLDAWITKLKPRYFKKIVEMVTNLVKYHVSLLESKQNNKIPDKSQIQLTAALEFLKTIYMINEKTKILSYTLFYIPTINEKIDIEKNFIDWATASSHYLPVSFSFCSYPFVFDAKAKSKLLQVEAGLFMRNAVLETHTNLIMSILNAQESGIINMETPFFEIGVNRETVLQDTLKALEKASQKEFKKPLKISFSNEEAVDDGGVVKEYFLLVIREIMLPKTGLFKCYNQSKMCYFQQNVKNKDNIYRCVGQLCGLAIYNGVIIDLHFPLVLFKKLLGEISSLDDLVELDPVLGNSLQQVLDYTGNDFKDVFGFYHDISWEDIEGKSHIHELVTNGKSVPVTNDNKEQFVLDYIHFILDKNVASGFDAFKIGFYLVCVGSVLKLFRPIELQEMMVGCEINEWSELQNNAVYEGDYWKGHQVIIWFWEVFKDLNIEKKKQFLRFLTGCDRAPITGVTDFKIVIQPTNGGDQFYPVAHTCYNLLDLPKYSSKKVLKTKLLAAIEHTEGFTLV